MTPATQRKLAVRSSLALLVIMVTQVPGVLFRWSGAVIDVVVLTIMLVLIGFAVWVLAAEHRRRNREHSAAGQSAKP